MEKLNFEEFEKKTELVISEEMMSEISGGTSDDNIDSDIDDNVEKIKPHAKF